MNPVALLPLAIPGLAALAAAFDRQPKRLAAGARAAAFALWALALWALLVQPLRLWDALALWYILLVAVLSGFCLLASADYVAAEVGAGEMSADGARRYFLLFHLCVGALLLTGVAANYFAIWAGVEGTTLTTVMLVALPGGERAVEAAWKYVVITGIGGLLALLGTVILLGGAGVAPGAFGLPLPAGPAGGSAALAVQVGFWLGLVGYGSKAGLVPLHTWLPDAHGEAPAPVSAILSGVKLVGGVYALLRLVAVAGVSLGPAWPHRLLILAGILSLALAAAGIAGQRDLKRLLAYSSIEHMGLIVLGAGFGGIALAGALLHMWTHGLGKTSLFFGAGRVRLRYGATGAPRVRGLLAALPLTGASLAVGAVALAGLPPFGLFWSEWLVLLGTLQRGGVLVAALALALLVAAFIGFGLRVPELLLGAPPADLTAAGSVREARSGIWAIGAELALLAVVGVALPAALHGVWMQAVRLGGG